MNCVLFNHREQSLMQCLSDLWVKVPTDILRLIVDYVLSLETYEDCEMLTYKLNTSHLAYMQTSIEARFRITKLVDRITQENFFECLSRNIHPDEALDPVTFEMYCEINRKASKLRTVMQNHKAYMKKHPNLPMYLYERRCRKHFLMSRIATNESIMDRITVLHIELTERLKAIESSLTDKFKKNVEKIHSIYKSTDNQYLDI